MSLVTFIDPSGGSEIDENGMAHKLTALDGLVECDWDSWGLERHGDHRSADYRNNNASSAGYGEVYLITKLPTGRYVGEIPED